MPVASCGLDSSVLVHVRTYTHPKGLCEGDNKEHMALNPRLSINTGGDENGLETAALPSSSPVF